MSHGCVKTNPIRFWLKVGGRWIERDVGPSDGGDDVCASSICLNKFVRSENGLRTRPWEAIINLMPEISYVPDSVALVPKDQDSRCHTDSAPKHVRKATHT
jgi:hypothetical protein